MLPVCVAAVRGLYVIPAKRRQPKADFSNKVAELRRRLSDALTRQGTRPSATRRKR